MSVASLQKRLMEVVPGQLSGYIREVSVGHLLSDGPHCSVGDICLIKDPSGQDVCQVEVVGVRPDGVTLIPLQQTQRILIGFQVVLVDGNGTAPVGDRFSGRMVDGLGNPLDMDGAIMPDDNRRLEGIVPGPLERSTEASIAETGIKALDTLIPIAKGQRIGVFAAAGVGKTTLLTQIARQTDCDRCVLCLVGERGREVASMWSSIHNGETTAELTAVISTSDQSATSRIRAVNQALCMAEYWRDAGEHVVLIIDSVTRYAMALREVGLATGGMPTLRAYTPNVFSALPRMVERCGCLKSGGAITGIFSILSETDEMDDPIVEAMKSYLDGHIILSRELAERGHFPAIDVPASLSRLMPNLFGVVQADIARNVVLQLSIYRKSRLLIESGMYKLGADAAIDRAIMLKDEIDHYLRQDPTERVPAHQAQENIVALMGGNHV